MPPRTLRIVATIPNESPTFPAVPRPELAGLWLEDAGFPVGTQVRLEVVKRVLAQPDITPPTGLRDRAMLETLYSTGIRRQELLNLELYDVDVEGRTLLIRQGKGRKDRLIPIGERALASLGKYLEEVRPSLAREPDDGTLFLSSTRRAFDAGPLSRLVADFVTAAYLGKRGACHLFRHTMARLMLEAGADLRFNQAMLGYASIVSTQVYTYVAIPNLKEVYDRTYPGGATRTQALRRGLGRRGGQRRARRGRGAGGAARRPRRGGRRGGVAGVTLGGPNR
jgi:integrase/recombinase XerD